MIHLLAATLAFFTAAAGANVGLTEVPGREGDAPVTLFYYSGAKAEPVKRGPFSINVAENGPLVRGNGRLVVVSHGSGGSPWPHADLARALVYAGFVVAMPEHKGDNYKDHSLIGPESWKRRPEEVTRAIDAVAQDPRFKGVVDTAKVGMYGMSAGGHTALTLAGGKWSPSRLLAHCEKYIADDFQGLDDRATYAHIDGRIAAIVAGVPFSTDFDPATLTVPGVPLGFVTARRDKWLKPRYHSDVVLAGCKEKCERLWEFGRGGHGALLSPLPPGMTGLVGDLLNDPAGFDRKDTVIAEQKIVAFFRKTLLP
ncbi:MAG: dienelactone hydrolase [Betaproteobacteria bacterium]|nr:dienelactone hydrolase [Betaproteobacteria bacterium]